jgi:hypothetical protein
LTPTPTGILPPMRISADSLKVLAIPTFNGVVRALGALSWA